MLTHPKLGAACAEVAARAGEHFAAADRLMARAPRASVRAPRLMGAAYRSILDALVARGWSVPRKRVGFDKLRLFGAGLAGLSAAVRLASEGQLVVLHEAGKLAGGRCRSYLDSTLGLTIDNGNHLLLSGNWATLRFVRDIGGMGALSGPPAAEFPFADLATGERWTLRPNEGRLPWWVLDPRRRVPRSRTRDYLAPLGILRAARTAAVGEVMACEGPLYERLWRPVLLAALNTDPREASAALAAQLLRETLGAGGQACRPLVATGGLSAAFVDPALERLRQRRAAVRFGARLRGIALQGEAARRLDFDGGPVELGPEDAVVLAVPPWVAPEMVPGLVAPTEFRAIVNAHFKLAPPPGLAPILGVVNGLTEWLFAYPDRLSVTISGADRLLDDPRERLAQQIWREVSTLTGLASELPPWQIVKERRATFAATPREAARRPGTRTAFRNLFLAGDWIATGLPATIEGAVRSGAMAAEAALEMRADTPRERAAA